MKIVKDFAGLDGFYWWFGVVESRQDPLKIGRCRVRIFGIHNPSLSDIPSEDLPWANIVHSTNNQMFSTPREGEMVFGFFVDGSFSQQPVIIGTIPYIPSVSDFPDGGIGFNDPRTPEEMALAPRKPRGISYGNNDGTGARVIEKQDGFELSRWPYDSLSPNTNYPTNSDLARNERIKSSFIQSRRDSLVSVRGAFGTSWKEPFPAYNAKYPYNKVMETESGHIQEFDDTPGAERIHTAHRSGTFEEIYPSGTKVEKIVKNNYKIVLADDHIFVAGKVNITVQSHANIKVEGDINLEGRGDLTAGIAGNMSLSIGGDFKLKAKTVAMETEFDYNIKSTGALKLATEGGLHLKTQKLKLSSENGLSLITGGELYLSGSSIMLQAATGVVAVQSVSLNVLSPITNMFHLNALTTGLIAVGADTNGAAHALNIIGISIPLPPFIPNPLDFVVFPAKKAYLGDAPTYGDPTLVPKFKETTPVDSAAFAMGGSTENVTNIDAFIAKQIDNGIYTKEQIDEGDQIIKKPVATDPNFKKNESVKLTVNNKTNGLEFETEVATALKLSDYFTVGSFTVDTPANKAPLKPQRGYSKGAIAANLKLLSINCLDKIKQKYPTMKVVNGFRYVDEFSDEDSQHEIGQAADIQFDSLSGSPAGYYDIALWIKDNIPYDQLLLEYRTTGSRSPWIHISYNNKGNRTLAAKTKVATTMNHKIVSDKLVKYDMEVAKITPVEASITTDGNITTETKPVYDADGKLSNVKIVTTVDAGGNKTEEVTINDGDVELITTTVMSPNGQIIGTPTVSRNKFESDDPRDGPGGILAKLIAGYSFIMNLEGGILAGLFRDATEPSIKQVEQYGNQVGNIADQIEQLVGTFREIGCKIYKEYSIAVGKFKRELSVIKDAARKAEDTTEKAANTKFTFGNAVHAVINVAIKELEDKLDDFIYSLLSSWDALVCKLINFWPNELKALSEEMDRVYDRLYGVYDRVIAQRAKKYKKLKDSIKTRTFTWCDDVKIPEDKVRTRKGCQQ